ESRVPLPRPFDVPHRHDRIEMRHRVHAGSLTGAEPHIAASCNALPRPGRAVCAGAQRPAASKAITIMSTPVTPTTTGIRKTGGASAFTALAEQIRAAGLLRRRYGYYWTLLIGLPLLIIATLVAFVWIGETWW